MQFSRLAAAVSLAFAFLIACGSSSSPPKGGPDAKTFEDAPKTFMDAPPGGGVNALGQLCPAMAGGGGMMCPTGNQCVVVTGVGTNTTTGYCTPNCNGMNSICTTGYTGPAGGMPMCVLGPQGGTADGCAIICTSMAQCPTGMSCVTASGSTKICVPT